MRKLEWRYGTYITIWLYLEDYSNAGLSYDEMETAIKLYADEHHMQVGSIRPSGINSNIIIEVREGIEYDVVRDIAAILEKLITNKKP